MSDDQQQSRQQLRLPAPSLFRGPPSQNASTAELLPPPSGQSGASALANLARPRTQTGDRAHVTYDGNTLLKASSAEAGTKSARRQQKEVEQSNDARVDAMWAEMQNTLEEVELNAASGANVFGLGHSRAIDDLRKAQIALAQAWARSEADDEGHVDEDDVLDDQETVGATRSGRGVFSEASHQASVDAAGSKANRRPSEAARHERTQLEEETKNDIRLARKRREANDRYFKRVNQGVVDVVAKLADVAGRMQDVELESREIWGEKDSIDGTSVT